MKKRAFTLIEVLLVALLLGIMAMVALPNLSNAYKKFAAEREINNIVSFLKYAQELAVKKREILDTKTGAVNKLPQVEIKSEGRELILKYMKEDKILRKLEISPRFKISTETPIMIFDGWGSIAIFGEEKDAQLINGIISVTDNRGKEYEIQVYSTGYINFGSKK